MKGVVTCATAGVTASKAASTKNMSLFIVSPYQNISLALHTYIIPHITMLGDTRNVKCNCSSLQSSYRTMKAGQTLRLQSEEKRKANAQPEYN